MKRVLLGMIYNALVDADHAEAYSQHCLFAFADIPWNTHTRKL